MRGFFLQQCNGTQKAVCTSPEEEEPEVNGRVAKPRKLLEQIAFVIHPTVPKQQPYWI
jgi:hypothetical protein